ncbi:helix-turn-helix transcriptional regulator [Arthrobacter sp. NicSoilC12]|uniref:helix-turn-helix domain-containing protein n=1 Tax=Arthrobacter sp. NicSoilC12 TaxID=2831001 RepID=UPI001CC37C48|nr:helix-turn-helix transcriptional regulator [Arthrobacter sp. NicSoilC12]
MDAEARAVTGPLRERGITLSESQIYRMVSQNPERISFQLLAALCDIFGVEANELFTFTAADARSKRQKQAAASGENVVRFADAYKPVRARILDDG